MGICAATMSPSSTVDTQSTSNTSRTSAQRLYGNESHKSLYEAGVQVKFLHLEAEVESLLQQLQAIKKQRLTTFEEVSVR